MKHQFQIYVEEGKLRGLYCCISLGVAICTSWLYSQELLFLCVRPLLDLDKSFIFTEVAEAFYVTLKVCALWSLASVLPLVLYQAWCFVAPSCFPSERGRWGRLFLLCSCLLAFATISAYTVVLPKATSILLAFEIVDPVLTVELDARIGPYVDLSLKMGMLVILFLQLPLVFGICFQLGALKPKTFTDNRKLLWLTSLLLAAFVSPPDLSAQLVLTLLLSLCWEGVSLSGFVFLWLSRFVRHKVLTNH